MKNYLHTLLNLLFVASLVFAGVSCSDDDPPLPDNVAAFESSELGMSADEKTVTLNVVLSRAVDTDVTLTVALEPTGVTYGTDFTTTPAAVNNTVTLTIAKGSLQSSIVLTKAESVLLDGDETLRLTITSSVADVVANDRSTVLLSFKEILSASGALEINGGGTTYPNKVFIDLSANRQTGVARTSWDLGFYTGDDDFRVVLNSTTGMMARKLDKYNLNDVTASDTVGFASAMVFASPAALPWIDAPSGNLAETAIQAIAATASENPVYIIQRGSGAGSPAPHRGWKKVRIVRNGTGYTLQHADIGATTFSEVNISKSTDTRFNYVHFENGAVTVEPAKTRWDIAWTYFTNTTSFGQSLVPYGFQDVILLNGNATAAAKVLTSTKAYADFAEADLAGLTFSTSQVAIGSDWRRTSPSPAVVYDDRYYIIRDAASNYYKLRFTALTTDGQRGRPQLEYTLVKKGN